MNRRAAALFLAVSAVWGLPYLLIKVAVDDVGPVALAWVRIALAVAVLLPLARRTGAFAQLRRRLPVLVAIAVIEMIVPFVLISVGEQYVTSSLAGILVAAMPLFVALLALRVDRSERVGGARLAGLGIGMVGVVLLLGVDVGGAPAELLGGLCIVAAAACYALGALLIKRAASEGGVIGAMLPSLCIAALLLAPAAAVTAPGELPSGGSLVALAALGVVCTAGGFWLYASLIAEAGASRAAVITYVNPAVAVALGVFLLGEDVGAASVAGLLLIIAGSWLSAGGGPTAPRRERAPATEAVAVR